ncbi:serine/threonine-protein kinase [Amnibacterium setariae]|uniref:non-specific serine/threonine protein kinase n=1 Tax=Amnibacterium setariae TaxID=2306585 RepID=A0A3A1TZY6_9MICO|nr:serine/threonine-protein kinase [Amnibacterium setariae]RIX27776.1 serine/threonine protein kinase [Amnibacterium setariae]
MEDDGRVLDDRYELRGLLGRGGAGTVHRAWDRERRREVAVKLIDGGAARPGRGEAEVLAGLDHPRLVALHDVLTTPDGVALVMELVDGPSLAARLEQGPLDADEAAVVLRDVASGLAHAHRRGVVHRDVKPGNVLLGLEGDRVIAAKLTDFGIARLADATRTTAERTVVGTLRYLSPEQARGERATAASDVYALGLTVLAALTGAPAFPGSATESLAGRLLRAPAVPEALPEDWRELLLGMTAPAEQDRLDASTAAALAHALGRSAVPAPTLVAAAAAPVRAVLPAARRPRRRFALVGGVAATGLLLGAAGAAVLAPAEADRALSAEDLPAVSAPPSRATVVPSAAPSPRTTAAASAADAGATAVRDDDDRGSDHRGRGRGRSGSGHGED